MIIAYERKDGTVEHCAGIMKIELIPERGEEIAKLRRNDPVWEIHSDCYEGHDNADTLGK